MIRRALAALALSCAFALPASAHDTFLWPSAFAAAPGENVSLALSSTAAFPDLDYGPSADRIAQASDGLVLRGRGPDALRFAFAPRLAGVQVLGVAFSPLDIDVGPEEISHYFAEIGVSAAARAAYEALPAPRAMPETYTKYVKTILCAAPCQRLDAEAGRPLGHALEFIAFVDRGGVSLRRFQLLAHGAPAADQHVALTTLDRRRIEMRADAEGRIELPADVHGPALLSAVILRPPAAPGARFTSDFATLTFSAP